VSNRDGDGSPGRPIARGGDGYSCIAELRMIETIAGGEATTGFLRFGDRVRIEMMDADGHSLFGAIDQTIEPYEAPR
jgi:fumarylacetoacetate (FAA) hydrolase